MTEIKYATALLLKSNSTV